MLSPDGEPLAVCVRDAFVAPPGRVLLAADYKQLEMRLFAAFSNDPQLQREVREGGPNPSLHPTLTLPEAEP